MSETVHQILDLIQSESIDLKALEDAFNAASHEERIAATRKLGGRLQSKLFEAAEGRAVTVSQMVPTAEPLVEVIHEGTNTLPAFRAFQKRFCRSPEELETLIGYNHNWHMFATTPGYYMAHHDSESGELIIDYTREPTVKPEAWPKIMTNHARLGHFIYAGMIDKMRRVSDHVTIGRAYKKKPMNAWFVLVRKDP